jgi:[acyl-carrier-protein] S-malonyltransferase
MAVNLSVWQKSFMTILVLCKSTLKEAANCLDKNFVKLCFASSDSTLTELENAYISLFLVSLSLNGILKEQGIIPSLVAGRDIGEYAALAAVDGITLPDAVYLLRKYSGLYQELLDQRKLTAINIFHVELETIKKACLECTNGNNLVTIAAYETDEQTLITGTNESINCLKKQLLP